MEISRIRDLERSRSITKNNSIFKKAERFISFFIKNEIKLDILTLEIDPEYSSELNKTKVNSYLKQLPEITGIFMLFSRIHKILDFIEDDYLKKLKLFGFDNTSQNTACFLNVTVPFLISLKQSDQGYIAIKFMNDYLIKYIIPSPKIYLPIHILIKENVDYNDYKI